MYSVKISILKQREQELQTALKAKYEEINKLDSGAGKALLAEFGSILINGVANGAGVPVKLKIPPKFYTAFLPPFISVFLIPRDLKKKKKLLSEFETLTEEYNKVVAELTELQGEELIDSLKEDEKGTGGKSTGTGTGVDGSGNRSAITQQQYIIFGIILLVLIMLFIYWKRRQ